MSEVVDNAYWLGPTYEFRAGEWLLLAGIPIEQGRLEWLLRRLPEGMERSSHSFVLDPGATREDLESALAELPDELRRDLLDQVDRNEPRLLSTDDEGGIA